MAATWDAPEDILLYYSGKAVLDPPRPYTLSKLTYQHAGEGVFVITLNDPKRLNCMSMGLVQELPLVIEHAKRDERCKAIVWTGAGRAFCTGGNFTDPRTNVPEEVYEGYINAGAAIPLPDIALAGATRSMIRFPKISISAVNGVAVGGGVNLAFIWQDLCYAAAEAKFRYPFAELGLVPELGSSILLSRIVGLPRAKEFLQLGKEFSAERAYELGLCNEVVTGGQVVSRAVEAARRLAAMPQFALRESKRLMNQDLANSIDGISEAENEALKKAIASPETQQAMAALMAKSSKSKL